MNLVEQNQRNILIKVKDDEEEEEEGWTLYW